MNIKWYTAVCVDVMRCTMWILVMDNERKFEGHILKSTRSTSHGVTLFNGRYDESFISRIVQKIYYISLMCGDSKYPKAITSAFESIQLWYWCAKKAANWIYSKTWIGRKTNKLFYKKSIITKWNIDQTLLCWVT